MEQPPAYSPQSIADLLPIYRPQDADGHIRAYSLRQVSAGMQTLTLSDGSGESFDIVSSKTGGFMNRKPHVIISRSEDGHRIAEGRFEIHGTGTNITYFKNPSIQHLHLEDSHLQLLRTTIGGHNHWWQPYPGNKAVLELINETEETVARFIFSGEMLQRRSSTPGMKKDGKLAVELGELQIVDALAGEEKSLEEILCSAVMVVERTRRRAAYLGCPGVATRQGTAWGMAVSPPGGFV